MTDSIYGSFETVGFTGSRRLTLRAARAIRAALARTAPNDVIVTGACIGVDAYVARAACQLGRHVHTIVPADRSRVDPDWPRYATTFTEMPEGTSYKDRNAKIVEMSTRLVAVPSHPEDAPASQRSGTWQTARLARAAGVPVEVVEG